MKKYIFGSLLSIFLAGSAQAEVASVPFEECVKTIKLVAIQLKARPIIKIDTNEVKEVHFPSEKGPVIINCTRFDGKMRILSSKEREEK